MSEKKLTTRIQQKTDTKANWDKAVNFVPLKGEYIYYSDLNRVKVGDGVKKLSELPFVTSISDITNGFSLNSQSDIVWNYSGHQDNWTNVHLPWNYGGLHWGKPATAFNPSSNRIDLFASEKDQESLDLIIRFGGDYTDAIKIVHDLSNTGDTYPALTLSADGWITCKGITVKNSYGENVFTGNTKINGSLSVGGKNVLTDHQSIKTLKTDNTAAQTPSANESIAGSGTINLHKIAKTGSYNDLNDKPTTLSGYGITDAYTKTEADSKFAKQGKLDELIQQEATARQNAITSVTNEIQSEENERTALDGRVTALDRRVAKLEALTLKTYAIKFYGNATEGTRAMDAEGLTWNKSDGGLCDFAKEPYFKQIREVTIPALDSSGEAVWSGAKNVFVYFPNIFDCAITESEEEGVTVTTVRFSVEGKKPLFRNADGSAATGGLIGKYMLTNDGRNIYGSFSGKNYVVAKNRNTAQSNACYVRSNEFNLPLQQINANFPKEAWDMLCYLFLVVCGNRNAQSVYESRTKVKSMNSTSGITDSINSIFGETSEGSFKVFGVEDWYGNLSTIVGGIARKNGKYYLGQSTALSDQTDYSTFVESKLTYHPTSYEYITKMASNEDGIMFPQEANGGSDSTYWCDYVSGIRTDNAWTSSVYGGQYTKDGISGPFCLVADEAWTIRGTFIGYRAFVLVP